MQLDNRNTYNTLGRMGPLYPRPEYRPPLKETGERIGSDASVKGDNGKRKGPSESLILSDSLKRKTPVLKGETPGRLNLASVKELVLKTSEDITELPPKASYGCPHSMIVGDGLLYPTYA